MNYAAEMGSGVMIYIPSFIKIASGIQKLKGKYTDTQTHRQHGDSISLLSFFQDKESRLKTSIRKQSRRQRGAILHFIINYNNHYCAGVSSVDGVRTGMCLSEQHPSFRLLLAYIVCISFLVHSFHIFLNFLCY
jgi:hypothetical protein